MRRIPMLPAILTPNPNKRRPTIRTISFNAQPGRRPGLGRDRRHQTSLGLHYFIHTSNKTRPGPAPSSKNPAG